MNPPKKIIYIYEGEGERERVRRRVSERGGEGDKEKEMLANVTGMKVGAQKNMFFFKTKPEIE